jgi:hypothetical protein
MEQWSGTGYSSIIQWAIVIGLGVLCVLFVRFRVAPNDVTVFRRGSETVWRLDSLRARRWFKKHFAGEVVNNQIIFDPDREQEIRDRVYAIKVHQGSTGFFYGADDAP